MKIARKLALTTGLIGITLAFIQVGLYTYFDLRYSLDQTEEKAHEILKSAAPSAAMAVFEVNPKASEEALKGLSQFDFVLDAQLNDELGNELSRQDFHRNIQSPLPRFISPGKKNYVISLKNPHFDEDEAFGELRMTVDFDVITRKLLKEGGYRFATGISSSLFLIALIFFMFE